MLQKILTDRKITQAELARITGIHVMQINRYATGKQTPCPKNAAKIAAALNISLFDIFPEYV